MLHAAATTEPLGLRVATFVDIKTWKVCGTCHQHKKMLNITPGVNFRDMVLPTDQSALERITPEGSPCTMVLRVQCSSTPSLLTVSVCMHWLGDSLWSLHIDDISKYAVSQLIQCRDLMHSLTQPVLFANYKKEITFANDSMTALLGFACNADAIGAPVDSFFSPPPFDRRGDRSITWQPSRVNTETEFLDILVSVTTLQVRDTTMHSLMAKDVRPRRTHVRPANLFTSDKHRLLRKGDDHDDANDVQVVNNFNDDHYDASDVGVVDSRNNHNSESGDGTLELFQRKVLGPLQGAEEALKGHLDMLQRIQCQASVLADPDCTPRCSLTNLCNEETARAVANSPVELCLPCTDS
eukprot:CAMPEP_0174350904 /NCGR_PEP_ID=MMETSP0811_2-20130205/8107_1 /TAXON_ID=73025 ORGANISM="Eutreptiella gymnastica-like, Strain CCMP1594" /NCGR_SAMPLE_ID=MMETSP0811_2 /ASSEMBLY_ACC=CAM_ASM_000667 /LENGTH=352 /DNA_ID=CAMNT_0015479637 /DNA_START=253 /DNA_END=1311 /DNA_ORIENTATION=-